jgi:hypothetical protein
MLSGEGDFSSIGAIVGDLGRGAEFDGCSERNSWVKNAAGF